MQCYPFKRINPRCWHTFTFLLPSIIKIFAFSSKPVPLKSDWLNQYSLTFLGQDALQSEEHDSSCQILKTHNFVYNYRKSRTPWKPCMNLQVKNPWLTVVRPNKVSLSSHLSPSKNLPGSGNGWDLITLFLIGKRRYFLAIREQFKKVLNNGSNFKLNANALLNDNANYKKCKCKWCQ